MPDDKIIITADEAENLLIDGDTVHNFVNPGTNILVGCNYDRDDVIATLRAAVRIEIAGDQAKAMRHAIAVWETKHSVSFFEANMDKVATLEATRAE